MPFQAVFCLIVGADVMQTLCVYLPIYFAWARTVFIAFHEFLMRSVISDTRLLIIIPNLDMHLLAVAFAGLRVVIRAHLGAYR